jgi:hypothetical protein
MRWAGHVTCMGVMRNGYKILVGKSERRDYLEDQGADGRIILDLIIRVIGWEGVDWIHLAEDRFF